MTKIMWITDYCVLSNMREEALIEQLAELLDKVQLDEIGMKAKIKAEIERHKKFQSALLGKKEKKTRVSDIDIRNYAKYVLREGAILEKRELLSCLKSKVVMANKEAKIV